MNQYVFRMFEEALRDVSQPSGRNLKKYSRLSIGRSYIDFLLDKDDYEKAASVCEQVLGEHIFFWYVPKEYYKIKRLFKINNLPIFG